MHAFCCSLVINFDTDNNCILLNHVQGFIWIVLKRGAGTAISELEGREL